MSRAARIIQALIAAGKPLPLADIVDAIGERELDRNTLSTRVSAQLSLFVAGKKLKRTGLFGAYRYAPTAIAQVDRRIKPATTKSTARKRRKADQATPPAAPRPSHTKVVLVSPTSLRASPAKLSTRDQLTADVAAFLAKGGQVQLLSPGESANPTRSWLEANGLAKPRKGRKQPITTTDDADLDDVAA